MAGVLDVGKFALLGVWGLVDLFEMDTSRKFMDKIRCKV